MGEGGSFHHLHFGPSHRRREKICKERGHEELKKIILIILYDIDYNVTCNVDLKVK